MFKLFGFLLGSFLITIFTVAAMFFFALHYLLRVGGIADCTWHGSVQTWLDANANGRSDPGEPPLRDVEIHVDDMGNQLFDISWPAATDRAGEAQVFASIPGCEVTVFEIYVDVPAGYRLTTPARIELRPEIWGSLQEEHISSFGFHVDP